MAKKKGSDPVERKLLADIRKVGWCCVDIAPEGTSPSYSFTV